MKKERAIKIMEIWIVIVVILAGFVLILRQLPYPPDSPFADQAYQLHRCDLDSLEAFNGKVGTTLAEIATTIIFWTVTYAVLISLLFVYKSRTALSVAVITMISNLARSYEEYFFVGSHLRADAQVLIEENLAIRKMFAYTVYIIEKTSSDATKIHLEAAGIMVIALIIAGAISVGLVLLAQYCKYRVFSKNIDRP